MPTTLFRSHFIITHYFQFVFDIKFLWEKKRWKKEWTQDTAHATSTGSWLSFWLLGSKSKTQRLIFTCRDLTFPWMLSWDAPRPSLASDESETKTESCDKALLPRLILDLQEQQIREKKKIIFFFSNVYNSKIKTVNTTITIQFSVTSYDDHWKMYLFFLTRHILRQTKGQRRQEVGTACENKEILNLSSGRDAPLLVDKNRKCRASAEEMNLKTVSPKSTLHIGLFNIYIKINLIRQQNSVGQKHNSKK